MHAMLFFLQSQPLKTVRAHDLPEHTDYAIHSVRRVSVYHGLQKPNLIHGCEP